MVGDHNRFAGYFFKGRPYGLVKRSAALEAYIVPDFSSSNDAVEIVGDNRITQASDQLGYLCTLLLITEQVRFHKYCASLPEFDRFVALKSKVSKFFLNAYAKSLRLFFKE